MASGFGTVASGPLGPVGGKVEAPWIRLMLHRRSEFAEWARSSFSIFAELTVNGAFFFCSEGLNWVVPGKLLST